MDDKKVKLFKMKRLNERLLTAPNGTSHNHRSRNVSPNQKDQNKEGKQPQKIKDLLKMMREPPNLDLESVKINQMCQLYPEFMKTKFNQNSEIRGGTKPSDFQGHLNQLQMDSFDDMKIPIESTGVNTLNNQFNYLYANMPPPSNKLYNFLSRRGTASSAISTNRKGCNTPNNLSSRSAARSPEDTLRQSKNGGNPFSLSFLNNGDLKKSINLMDACKLRGEQLLKQNELNGSTRYDSQLNTSTNKNRAQTVQDNSYENQLQKSYNNSQGFGRQIATPDTFYRRNISTSQSRRSQQKTDYNKVKFDESNITQNNFMRSYTQTDAPLSPTSSSNNNNNRNKEGRIGGELEQQVKFLTEPEETYQRPLTTTTNTTIYNKKIDEQYRYDNQKINNNNLAHAPLSNLQKQETKDKAEWRLIEFVHKRRSLSLTPDCQKVNQIIRKQQANQTPKNCSLNAQIETSQLQKYFDQYLITSKPMTPTKVKDIRQRLAISKEILREQGIENNNPQRKKIQDMLSTSSPSFMLTQSFDDPQFFLKNRLSPSKINYRLDRSNHYQDIQDAIPEDADEDNCVENTPRNINSSPQIQRNQKEIIKIKEFQEETKSQQESEDTDEEEENLQIYKENSDDDYDEDDLEEKQRKLQILKQRKARRSKDIQYWEKQARESFIKSPENDQKSYFRQTASSQKQRKVVEVEDEKRSQSVQQKAFAQINTILNACQKVTRQNKIDSKLFKKAHHTFNSNNDKFVNFLPKGEEEEDNFEADIKNIQRDEKLHDFLKEQIIIDYEDSLMQVQAARTQSQMLNDLSRPKELISYVKNNILDSVIRNPIFYNNLLTGSRKKKLKENKVKIKSYVNQQDKDMSKLVKYSDFISFK